MMGVGFVYKETLTQRFLLTIVPMLTIVPTSES